MNYNDKQSKDLFNEAKIIAKSIGTIEVYEDSCTRSIDINGLLVYLQLKDNHPHTDSPWMYRLDDSFQIESNENLKEKLTDSYSFMKRQKENHASSRRV